MLLAVIVLAALAIRGLKNCVILSGARISRSEVLAQSKDPYRYAALRE